MNNLWLKRIGGASLAAACSMGTGTASAGATFILGDDQWVSLGLGLRTSFNAEKNGAPNGDDYSKDFRLDSARIYLNGQFHEYVAATMNTEIDSSNGDAVRVLDAIARFEFNDYVNLWGGRMLPPSDRSNLDGPFYLNIWDFPAVSAYPAIFAGRDDGVSYWGEYGGGKAKWQFGAFDGPATADDTVLWAGRVQYAFWDPEPGYYASSTYFGTKDILTVGASAQTQDGNTSWNIDALMEKNVGSIGTFSLEGSYYDYGKLGGLGTPQPGETGTDSTGWLLLGGYLLPKKIGIGQPQIVARYQNGDVDNGPDGDIFDINLNYIIAEQNAKVNLVYQKPNGGLFGDDDIIRLGVQVQI